MKALFVAIGNPLRGDDGVARRVLALLPPGNAITVHGLTPELADRVAGEAVVVFLDADPNVENPVLEPLGTGTAGRLYTHGFTPGEIIALARRLFSFQGEAWICRLPAFEFPHGEILSPRAEEGARKAADLLPGCPWTASGHAP